MSIEIADPRIFSAPSDRRGEQLMMMAESSLAASSMARMDEIDHALAGALAQHMLAGDAPLLEELVSGLSSNAVTRQLWRGLIEAWSIASQAVDGDQIIARLFALPVVIVAGHTADGQEALAPTLAGSLADAGAVNALLREHRILGDSLNFSLAATLVSADALDAPRLPQLLAWQRLAPADDPPERALTSAPMAIDPRQESVHLRFLLGSAIGASPTRLFGDAAGQGGLMPLAQELSRQLTSAGASALALPRPPQAPLLALQHGRAAQREIGAQIFASNAIRRFRSRVGEPSAVISAHRCAIAHGGGELRLSLSSPFDPREAEGFRCPLFPFDRAMDAAAMLVDLVRDCRVTDVRILGGVQADRDASTGMTLLFRADTLPDSASAALH